MKKDYWSAVDEAIDEIKYELFLAAENRMSTYLFALVDRQGNLEFHEIEAKNFSVFKETLSFSHYVDYDWCFMRPKELAIRKEELRQILLRRWLERATKKEHSL